ncbi:putative Peroxyureidoacrylate/ureidoacrylate amidohydrolase RutB [Amylocarpus encephaloides]|uniref:Peroxyureidoacrylate/ureidoacrylate amidohydrolase RutB n=1 Tax=Amylocarpus encephaloides TaxID=45428 RepID=A0A9P7YPY7_9HELO|nr:putative Peroxyureidoacrylate/ureidoacrylate amidohydrolase RutB [Amylocarpus encephaloides]
MAAKVKAKPYSWPIEAGIDPKTTALVIIDMQRDFCSPGGYLAQQGYNISPVLDVIPRIQCLLEAFRRDDFPIYHTREGHRPSLATLSSREYHRSKLSPLGIGDAGPLGRLLIRGEEGHSIISELTPSSEEEIIDKPGRSAFAHTEFDLMLRIKGIKNLIIVGVTTDVCVHSTMREANDRAYDCLLVEDACAASGKGLHEGAIGSVMAEGGIFGAVGKTVDVLKALGAEIPEYLKGGDIEGRLF